MKSWTIACKCNQNRNGKQNVKVDFLNHLEPKLANDWQIAFQQYANRYSTPTSLHCAIKVLQLWLSQHQEKNIQYPLPPILPNQASVLMKNLRRDTYGTMVTRNLQLQTVTYHWRSFLALMKHLSIAGHFPILDWEATIFQPYKATHARVTRSQVSDGTLIDPSMIPKNLDNEADSYHTELLVPLSIHLTDDAYLSRYERSLNEAIEKFNYCAEKELRQLKRCYELGKAYVKSVDYSQIQNILDSRKDKNGNVCRGLGGYIDPLTGRHYFDHEGGHPYLIRNLVAMVHHEMSGIPQPWIHKRKCVGPGHWRFVRNIGKNKLLPYLGILTSRTAVPFIVLLMLENPRINVGSLLSAKLEDKYGRKILISHAGDDGNVLRLTVDKPRSKSQKHSSLTGRSLEILRWLIRFTEPIRDYLRSQGREEESRWLWVGITNPKHYEYGRLSSGQLSKCFQPPPASLASANKGTRTPYFLRSHTSLNDWIGKTSLRALRVSKGVSIWFRSNGDPVVTAQAFGHRRLQVTLDNYVPKPLQSAMYERQVRRWQNLLICSASANKSYLLSATDFSTCDQLHEFLKGLLKQVDDISNDNPDNSLISIVRNIMEPKPINHPTPITPSKSNQIILLNDPERVALLFLYREHLLPQPSNKLDCPDQITGTTPRFWFELATALHGDFMEEQNELKELVFKAKQRAKVLRNHVQFTHH